MNKAKKIELLDYAIERINQYDKADNTCSAIAAVTVLPHCSGCSLADYKCSECPFNITNSGGLEHRCRGEYFFNGKTAKEHQNDLIDALKRWCRKFNVPFTIERIK